MQNTVTIHEGWTDATPEGVGYDSQAIRRLDDHYADLIEKGTIQAASYLLARKGKVFAHRSMGKLRGESGNGDIKGNEANEDLKVDSIRKVYSITKAVTAVAIHQLIDRGQLFLTQSAGSILPEMNTDKHKEITIFHLLTHTSGLRGDPGFYTEPYGLPWFEWAVRELKEQGNDIGWIKAVLAGPLQNMPGKEWIYSTSAFALLGEVIARVSGKPFDQYIHDEILAPLGMDRSFFDVPEAYYDEVCCTNDWETDNLYRPRKRADDAPPRAGNGMFSTLADLWRFGQMMLNGGELDGTRIVSKRAVELQTTNHLHGVRHNGWGSKQTDYKYGLGWSLEHYDLCSKGTFSHEGFGHCGLFVDPAEELVFVFFVPGQKGYTNESVILPRAIAWSGLL
ncbi:serine hydrolase domain-containing protein [Paenibacillus harenae]|uniref:CubicO group peptidase (Beta-lactamase class C family) n=1 Tax=Paenibacillus harenae TaxID=306543 RepID=A0ABT9U2Y8_PAEHA|nr:serine hydrolase domain-containing protein [Paenibacillus harenae]MDQ0113913.1 CubicO group peptidase (beta-lactamase class C family) [Paenibacillus harenae]